MNTIEFVDAQDPIAKAVELHTSNSNSVVICDSDDAHRFETCLVVGVKLELKRTPKTVILVTSDQRALSLLWWPLISQDNTHAIWINAPESFRNS